ncbi:MAG: hypothetical protein WBI17_09835 [Clostridiaceae bacterium]
MDRDEMKQALELEILAKLIDEVEIAILEKKAELLLLGKEFVSIVVKEHTSGSVKFKDEAQDDMENIRKQYNDLVQDISKQVKLHHYIIMNHEEISDYLNGWLRTENYEIVKINKYINESFERKILDIKE